MYTPFAHREVDAGYASPCHRAVHKGGDYSLNRDGYAVLSSKVTTALAHRARWEEAGNPRATLLDHLCRNRWCCNPAHLEAVTQAENVRRGNSAKLDAGEVALIRVLRADGVTQAEIAREFGISPSHTSRIVAGLYWGDGPCKHWASRKGGTQNL